MEWLKGSPLRQIVTSSAIVLSLYGATMVQAEEVPSTITTQTNDSNDIQPSIELRFSTEDDDTPIDATLSESTKPTVMEGTPKITNVNVSGGIDEQATGITGLNGVDIQLTGKHLTDDNFLTAQGLR